MKNKGTILASVPTDIDGDLRGTTYDIGADQYSNAINLTGIWIGGVSTSWLTTGNWCLNTLPSATDNVTISSGASFYPVIDVTSTTGVADSLTIGVGGSVTLSGGTLTIHGQLNNSGTYNHSSGTLKTYYMPVPSTLPLITGAGTFNYTGGDINFAASGAQNIPTQNYWGVTTSGSGTKSLIGDATVNGNLVLNTGTVISIGANSLTLNGAITSSGGSITGGTTSKLLFAGSSSSTTLPAVSGGLSILSINRASGITLGANVTVDDTLYLSNGVLDMTTNTDSVFLPNAGNIVRSGGSMNATPTVTGAGSTINLFYLASLATGNELPSTVNNVSVTASGVVTLSANLTVNGDMTINSGTFAIGSHALSLGGNLTTIGAISSTSSSDLTIADFTSAAATLTLPTLGGGLHNLTMNRANGANITGNLNIANTLDMTLGVLNTDNIGGGGNMDTIILASSASMINESATSYVNGRIQTSAPVANDGITYSFGNLGTDITVPTTASNPGGIVVTRSTGINASNSGSNILDHSGNRTGRASATRVYHIAPTNNGGLNAALVLHYLDGELNGVPESGIDIYRKPDGGTVFFWAPAGTRNTTSNTIALRYATDSFSDWTVGGTATPLPVEMTTFTAQLQDETSAKLNWITASEINNDHFDIERSEDGRTFAKVGEKAGHGTTQIINRYDYVDRFGPSVLSPVLYYRLRQVDYNGAFTYSEVRKVVLAAKTEGVKVWYNHDIVKLQGVITVNNDRQVAVKVIDAQGKPVAEQSIHVTKGGNAIELDMQGYAQGVYTFIYSSDEGVQTKKFIKY